MGVKGDRGKDGKHGKDGPPGPAVSYLNKFVMEWTALQILS